MNPSKLYVPDPQKWIHFFKHSHGHDGGTSQKLANQFGGSSLQTKHEQQSNKVSSTEQNCAENIDLVSPVKQNILQTKKELEREGIKPLEYRKIHI